MKENGRRPAEWAMRIMATFIDSGGHFTEEIYRQSARRAVRRFWPIKGKGGLADSYVRPMKGKTEAGGDAFIIGVDMGKEAVYLNAAIEEPGPRYMHYPLDDRAGYDRAYFKGLFAERQVLRRKNGRAFSHGKKFTSETNRWTCAITRGQLTNISGGSLTKSKNRCAGRISTRRRRGRSAKGKRADA